MREGLGWPDRTYNNSVTGMSSTTTAVGTAEGTSDIVVLEKIDRQEPLLPGRRALLNQSSALAIHPNRAIREKSNYAFDEQVSLRNNNNGNSITTGLTQEALNELLPASRLATRRLFHDIVLRKPSAGNTIDTNEPTPNPRRTINPNSLAPIKPALSSQRGNILILQQPQQQQQQQKVKPRSLPNSTLDHANPNGFHLPHDPYGSRASKIPSRTSHVEQSKRNQPNSPIRYNPGQLVK